MLMYLFESRLYDGGWIKPDGEYLKCDHSNNKHHSHIGLEYFKIDHDPDDNDELERAMIIADNAAYSEGWIRISSSDNGDQLFVVDASGNENGMTQAAYRTLRKILTPFRGWTFSVESPQRNIETDRLSQVYHFIRTQIRMIP